MLQILNQNKYIEMFNMIKKLQLLLDPVKSKLWDHLFFDDCLNYLNFNSVSDKICSLDNLNAIKIRYKMSPE